MRARSRLCWKFSIFLNIRKIYTVQINQIVQARLKKGKSKKSVKILIKEIQQDLWGGQATISGVRVLHNGRLSHMIECTEGDILPLN